jgi:hypothetical protein
LFNIFLGVACARRGGEHARAVRYTPRTSFLGLWGTAAIANAGATVDQVYDKYPKEIIFQIYNVFQKSKIVNQDSKIFNFFCVFGCGATALGGEVKILLWSRLFRRDHKRLKRNTRPAPRRGGRGERPKKSFNLFFRNAK